MILSLKNVNEEYIRKFHLSFVLILIAQILSFFIYFYLEFLALGSYFVNNVSTDLSWPLISTALTIIPKVVLLLFQGYIALYILKNFTERSSVTRIMFLTYICINLFSVLFLLIQDTGRAFTYSLTYVFSRTSFVCTILFICFLYSEVFPKRRLLLRISFVTLAIDFIFRIFNITGDDSIGSLISVPGIFLFTETIVILARLLATKKSVLLTMLLHNEEEQRTATESDSSATGTNEKRGAKVCPMCAEKVKAQAKICRFCGYKFESD